MVQDTGTRTATLMPRGHVQSMKQASPSGSGIHVLRTSTVLATNFIVEKTVTSARTSLTDTGTRKDSVVQRIEN